MRNIATVLILALVLLAALGSVACHRVCADLAHLRFDVELDEPYDAGSQFEYSVAVASPPSAMTCGDLEMGARSFRVETPKAAENCVLYWGTLDGLDQPTGRTILESADRYPTNRVSLPVSNVYAEDIVAERSRVTLGGVCAGIYTVVLRRTGYDVDNLQVPVPGELPPWVVVRSFEAQASCPMLGLAENGVCSDVWDAHLTGLSHL